MTKNGKQAAVAGSLLVAATALHVYDRHPIWNLIIFVPVTMGVTLLVIKLRERRSKREDVT